MNQNLKIKKCNIYNIHKIKPIYTESFSKENRFPFFKLVLNALCKNSEIYILIKNKEVVAFLYAIIYYNQKFILYLAVKENKRNKKIGSYLLKWYLTNNKDSEVLLNIDEVNSRFNNYILRKKRLNFYLKNGFYLTNYLAISKETKQNILSTKKEFNLQKYKNLDKKISYYFLCKRDKIVKKEE